MLSAGDIPTKRGTLASGDAGTDQTVAAMRACAMGIYGAKSPKIREFAINILDSAQVKNKDYRGMTIAIHNWVRDNIRYVNDPVGQETVCHPEYVIQLRAGDCDDASTLEAALLGALGIDTRFVVVGLQTGGGFSHVYLQAEVKEPTGLVWMSLDPIMRQYPAGWEVPNAKRKKIYDVNSAQGFAMNGLGHMLSESIGSPAQTYVGNPARTHSPWAPPINTIQQGPNYVSQSANDNGWNNPEILPEQAFPMQGNTPDRDTRQGWASAGKAPNGFLNGLEGDFGTMRPSQPTSAPAYANVGTVRARRQGVDHLLSGDNVSIVPSGHVRGGVMPGIQPTGFGAPAMSQRPPSRKLTSVAGLGAADDIVTTATSVPAVAVAAPATIAPVVIKSALAAVAVWFFFLRK
jgi:hypothetical protein